MPTWVRMKHKDTGGTTLVIDRSIAGWEKRGWEVVPDERQSALTEPAEPKAKPKPAKNPLVKEDPASDASESDSNKEDG